MKFKAIELYVQCDSYESAKSLQKRLEILSWNSQVSSPCNDEFGVRIYCETFEELRDVTTFLQY